METGLFSLVATACLLLGINWGPAQAFFDNFNIKKQCYGFVPSRCEKTAAGKLSCVKNEPLDGPVRYWCKFGEGLLDVEGEPAQNAFSYFKVEGSLDQMGNTTKAAFGTLTCTLDRRWDARPFHHCIFESP